jgi:hypothetical protein
VASRSSQEIGQLVAGGLGQDLVKPVQLYPPKVLDDAAQSGGRGHQPAASILLGHPTHLASHRATLDIEKASDVRCSAATAAVSARCTGCRALVSNWVMACHASPPPRSRLDNVAR